MTYKTMGKYLAVGTALFFLGAALMAGAANASVAATAKAAGKRDAGHPSLLVEVQDKRIEGARNFIASMGDRGINFLGNKSMTMSAKQAEFKKLLNDSFDMSTIGRFALGTYWREATPAQQKEYQKLFNQMVVRVYSQRFSEYQGQKFEVRSARNENDRDTVVTSFIVPASGPRVQVDWRVRNRGGSYKVVDIVVEGVSMSMTQRADFASVIQRGGGKVEALLEHLRK